MPSIGQTIAHDRERIGLTQEQLAARLGVTQQAVSRWEDGRSMPRAKRLREILTVLGRNSQTAAAIGELATQDGPPTSSPETTVPLPTPSDQQAAAQLAIAAQQIARAAQALAESATAIAQAAQRLASTKH